MNIIKKLCPDKHGGDLSNFKREFEIGSKDDYVDHLIENFYFTRPTQEDYY
jgi:hypothetical protein